MKIAAANRCPSCNFPSGQMTTSGGAVVWFAIYDGKRCSKSGCALCGRQIGKK